MREESVNAVNDDIMSSIDYDFAESFEREPRRNEMEKKQNIWRTVSVPDHNGVFVWEVSEYMALRGETPVPRMNYIQCRDGSWVSIQCFHCWTTEGAERILNDHDMEFYGAVYHTI
jgi:hypothetical protein